MTTFMRESPKCFTTFGLLFFMGVTEVCRHIARVWNMYKVWTATFLPNKSQWSQTNMKFVAAISSAKTVFWHLLEKKGLFLLLSLLKVYSGRSKDECWWGCQKGYKVSQDGYKAPPPCACFYDVLINSASAIFVYFSSPGVGSTLVVVSSGWNWVLYTDSLAGQSSSPKRTDIPRSITQTDCLKL